MSGGRNKGGPKHQNKTAYKIQFNPLALVIHKKVSLRGLCKRCADQITWKMQYNKYKKMSEPAKCGICTQKNVLRSYMAACQPCAQSLKMCPKCLDLLTEDEVEGRLNQIEQKKQDEESERKMNDYIKTLKERSRRTVKRLFEKGTIKWNPDLNTFVDEEGVAMTLQFRQGYGDKDTLNGGDENDEEIDEFGEDDEDNEEQEVKSKKDKSKSKQKAPKKDAKEDAKVKPASKHSDNDENQDEEEENDDEIEEEDEQEGNDDNEETCVKIQQEKTTKKTITKQKEVKAEVQVVEDGNDQDWQDEQGEQQEQEETVK